MNDEKKTQYILVTTIILLLLTVLIISIILYIKNKNNRSNELKITFNQIFVSDYEVNYLGNDYFIEEDNNQIISIINTNGKVISEQQIPIKYTNLYQTKDGKYIIFNNEDNLLEIYTFDGKDIKKVYTNEEATYTKPIIFEQNDISYIVGFTFTNDNNLYIYNVASNKIITLKDTILMADRFSNNNYYVNNENYLVVKNQNDKLGIINYEGEIIIPYKYNNINTLPNNHFIVTNTKNKYGLIDESDNEIIPCLYKVIANFNDYYLIVNTKNKMALYNNEYKQIIPFKMNYNETVNYDYRGNSSSINLYKIDNNLIVINNYLELQNKTEYVYHDMYIINDSKINYTLNESMFNNDNIIYTYNKNNILTIYDTSFNKIKEIELTNASNIISFKYINNNTIELIYENETINKKYYNKDYNEINYEINDIVLNTNDYYVTLKKDNNSTLEVYDLSGNLINSISGNNIKIKNEYIIVDHSIYKIMTK